MSNNTKKRRLNNGMEIPLIGLGTSKIVDPADVVYNSIKHGIRLIDTAFKYENEEEVGEGIKKALNDKICKREDLIIIGKIWSNYRDNPEKALRGSLKRLKLDYIDIYLDHWPSGIDYRDPIRKDKFNMVSIYDFWPKMEALIDLKLTKAIGVSNYNVQCLCNLLSFCKIKPVVNEVEYHLFYIQKNLKEFCDKENITVISYYPIPHGNGVKTLLIEHPEMAQDIDIFQDQLLNSIAKKYNKTSGQIILNWHNHVGVIPIPGTSKLNRAEENIHSLDFKLENEDVEKLSTHFKQISFKKFCGCKRFFGVNVLA